MKTSIFLTSFFSMNTSGSKSLTSPAIRAEKSVVSNFVMGPMPLHPWQSAFQFASVPMPTEDTRPMPVTTTRFFVIFFYAVGAGATREPQALLLLLAVGFNVFDRFLYPRDLLGVLVGNLDAKLFLESH